MAARIIKIWLVVSLIGFAWNLIPIASKYRLRGQELVNLERERRRPEPPVVTVPEDTPWPRASISMSGRATEGAADDAGVASLSFGTKTVVLVDQVAYLINPLDGTVQQTTGISPDGERIFQAAISGDGRVVATVGQFPVIRFWDAKTGAHLQTVEDKYPTIAAQPNSGPGRHHTSGLEYSDTGARRIVAATGGCLFAIGKIDGSIELWNADEEPLPDRPYGIVTSEWPHTPDTNLPVPRRFYLHQRIQPHVAQVEHLQFTLDCQSLLSVSTWTVTGIHRQTYDGYQVAQVARANSDESEPKLVRSRVSDGSTEWQVNLNSIPSAISLDRMSEPSPIPRSPAPARMAIADRKAVQIRNLQDGSIMKTLSVREQIPGLSISSVAFGTTSSGPLWTVGQSFADTIAPDASGQAVCITAWQPATGRQIVTARLPGHAMSIAWSRFGHQLAISRLRTVENQKTMPREVFTFPWSTQPSSPFITHIWDVGIRYE
ncbi:MAG: hypothetical protein KDA91_18820 [Planctomycetaceae bacterium]|nr:hypothetical protein [Planctomycetaceae bacterium]